MESAVPTYMVRIARWTVLVEDIHIQEGWPEVYLTSKDHRSYMYRLDKTGLTFGVAIDRFYLCD